MVTVRHKLMQNIGFSVGIRAKNDPLNIPIFGFELIFLKEVRSSNFQFYFLFLVQYKYLISKIVLNHPLEFLINVSERLLISGKFTSKEVFSTKQRKWAHFQR